MWFAGGNLSASICSNPECEQNMKHIVTKIIKQAITQLYADKLAIEELWYQVDYTKKPEHGDVATNIAMQLAKQLKCSPMVIAEQIVAAIATGNIIAKITIARPGFINFFLAHSMYHSIIPTILDKANQFGCNNIGNGQAIHLEFVSVNPTGPLHVGHGRNAAYGSALASCLEANGYQVHREYYVNDAGRQMDILAISVYLRYLSLLEQTIEFPSNGYQGDYIFNMAKDLINDKGKEYLHKATDVFHKLPLDATTSGDQEKYIDALITRCKMLLGDDNYCYIHQFALDAMIANIKTDLDAFRVHQHWFSEQSLIDENSVEEVVDLLTRKDCVYSKEHALWFRSTNFGDDKDRVLIRANGQYTYFATDIANHYHKYLKDYAKVINVWGADHHGYVCRVKAAITAMGLDETRFRVELVQFATLYRGSEKVQMSTRSGSFIKLKDLMDEVGVDATRFFYIMRKCDQHMDFDINLAKSKTTDNPIYYIQYAYARICSVMDKLNSQGMVFSPENGLDNLCKLNSQEDLAILKILHQYPEVVELSGKHYSPHVIAQYLKELATSFHNYYSNNTLLVPEEALRNAKICLVMAVKQVIYNGLTIIGITSTEKM